MHRPEEHRPSSMPALGLSCCIAQIVPLYGLQHQPGSGKGLQNLFCLKHPCHDHAYRDGCPSVAQGALGCGFEHTQLFLPLPMPDNVCGLRAVLVCLQVPDRPQSHGIAAAEAEAGQHQRR